MIGRTCRLEVTLVLVNKLHGFFGMVSVFHLWDCNGFHLEIVVP